MSQKQYHKTPAKPPSPEGGPDLSPALARLLGSAAPGAPRPASRLPGPLLRLLGRHAEDTLRGMDLVKSKVGGFFKRAGFHLLALLVGWIIAQGTNLLEQTALFYFGAICLLPRGFSPRRNSYLFPGAVSLAQFAITLLLGYPLYLSLFLAGAQSWLQRAVIRRFRLGLEWVAAPFLIVLFVWSARDYDLPLALLGLATLCGLGAYYAAGALDRRKRARLEAEALARAESASPFRQFYLSAGELEHKAAALPEDLRGHAVAIALHGRNILDCMPRDPNDVQAGTRFLSRYLPAAHNIVDEYVRLGREGHGHQDIEAVLGRVDEILERLVEAFQQEHGSLLRNDAMQLSAELKVLDKLLKMDGR